MANVAVLNSYTIAAPVSCGLCAHVESPDLRMAELCVVMEGYLEKEHIQEVYRAYLFSAEAHAGQYRQGGGPYVLHPIAVAQILAEMRLDHKCLMAAILHDVIEDTGVMKEALVREFGAEVADMVDGVSKLTMVGFKNRAEAQAASMSKMLLAMTKDIRVILIKLADRLHNMRTLGALSLTKSKRIAKETLDIYAPIADRLGINNICMELEDRAFYYYWPWRYRCLRAAVGRVCRARSGFITIVENAINTRLQQEAIEGVVVSRQKHLYGIYRKMREKHRSFSEVADFYGMRVVVDRLDSCYRTLGSLHNLYKPVPGRFKDYIAIPKPNGYQSLHTLVVGPNGIKVEVQIRTQDMHKIAESGIAAHWLYKATDGHVHKAHTDWLKRLLEMQHGSNDLMDFVENVKIDLFPEEVYVLTPKGKILTLPRGATVIDFAYAIHSKIGDACVSARIDHRLAPVRTVLRSGQTIDILTVPNATPQPGWLNFVVTNKARVCILQALKRQESQEAAVLGQNLLEQELQKAQLTWALIPEKRLQMLLQSSRVETVEDLWRNIGLGHILPKLIVWKLKGEIDTVPNHDGNAGRFVIKGSEGVLINFGKCCHPIVGDNIVGMFNPGRGIVVHRHGCRNIGMGGVGVLPNKADVHRHGHNWLTLEWEQGVKMDLPTEITIEVGNRRGTLATVATTIANAGSNIEHFNFVERDGLSAALSFLVTVQDIQHLSAIMANLQNLPIVIKAERVFDKRH